MVKSKANFDRTIRGLLQGTVHKICNIISIIQKKKLTNDLFAELNKNINRRIYCLFFKTILFFVRRFLMTMYV